MCVHRAFTFHSYVIAVRSRGDCAEHRRRAIPCDATSREIPRDRVLLRFTYATKKNDHNSTLHPCCVRAIMLYPSDHHVSVRLNLREEEGGRIGSVIALDEVVGRLAIAAGGSCE